MVQEGRRPTDPPAFGKLGLVTGDAALFRRGAELGDGFSMTELGRIAKRQGRGCPVVSQGGGSRRSQRHGAICVLSPRTDSADRQKLRRGDRLVQEGGGGGQPAAMTRLGILGDKKLIKQRSRRGLCPRDDCTGETAARRCEAALRGGRDAWRSPKRCSVSAKSRNRQPEAIPRRWPPSGKRRQRPKPGMCLR